MMSRRLEETPKDKQKVGVRDGRGGGDKMERENGSSQRWEQRT